MLNQVVLIGRLAQNPELRYTPQGTEVCSFTLAVERSFTNREGEREVDFIDCTAWRKLGENVSKYLEKGSLAAVDGRLQIDKYENRDGNKRTRYEVIAEDVRFLPDQRRKNRDNSGQNLGSNGLET